MGLFDLGNKTRAYKQGITDDAEVSKEKVDDLSQALKAAEGNLENGLGLLQDDVSNVNDILASDAKEKLLGLVQQLSFKDDLDDTNKKFLIATLVTLGHEIGSTSNLQKHYLRSISRYLGVSPEQGADIYGIENIVDAESSQLIFRAVNEYIYLYNGTFNLVTDNEKIESYFDCFNINNRAKREINSSIQNRIAVMGNEGLIVPFEVTVDKISAMRATEKSGESKGKSDRAEQQEEAVDDLQAKLKMIGTILKPIDYFQGYQISIYPKADVVKAREICGYDYLNIEADDLIAVFYGNGDDGIFGDLSRRIGIVFLKDRIISNRQTFGHVTKKHVEFNVVLYKDLKIEEKPNKSYVAYNGTNWDVGSPKQADKMIDLLKELKGKADQIMVGKFVESSKSADVDTEHNLKKLAEIVAPIRSFEKEKTSVYPHADLSKAKEIAGFQYMNVTKDNLVAVMFPKDMDGVFGKQKDTIGVVFLKDRIISNRMPWKALRKSKINFDVTLYKNIQGRMLAEDNKYIGYSGINWKLNVAADVVQMIYILNDMKKIVLTDSSSETNGEEDEYSPV